MQICIALRNSELITSIWGFVVRLRTTKPTTLQPQSSSMAAEQIYGGKKRSPEQKAIIQCTLTYIQVSGTWNNEKELKEFHLLLYNTLAAGWRGQKKAECSSVHGVCKRQRKCGRLVQTEAGRHEARERRRAKEFMCLILMLDLGHDCQKSGNIFLVSFLWLQH